MAHFCNLLCHLLCSEAGALSARNELFFYLVMSVTSKAPLKVRVTLLTSSHD